MILCICPHGRIDECKKLIPRLYFLITDVTQMCIVIFEEKEKGKHLIPIGLLCHANLEGQQGAAFMGQSSEQHQRER